MKEKAIEKVIEFAQSESKAKQFRHDYPITEEVRDVMLDVIYKDFTKYVLERNFAAYHPMLKEYVDDHYLKNWKRQTLEHNLFWWQMLYNSNLNGISCVNDYIAENYHDLCKKPLITSWLREWEKVIPKFYYVGHKYNDQVLVVVDILREEALDVIVYDSSAVPPEKGEIAMGILIPLGDALYFPIIDFYHFDIDASKDIARHLHHYYDKHLKSSTMLEAFIHVLSAALQIERLIFLENQEKIPSN